MTTKNLPSVLLLSGVLAIVGGGWMGYSRASLVSVKKDPFVMPLSPTVPSLETPTAAIVPQPSPETLQSPEPVQPVPAPVTYRRQQVLDCAGENGGANFRQYPTLDPAAVLGVAMAGSFVDLTGKTIRADGIVWHEAIAPTLVPSSTPGAINQWQANQVGWIAECFVDGG